MGMNALANPARQTAAFRERAGSVLRYLYQHYRVHHLYPQLQTEGLLPAVCPDPDDVRPKLNCGLGDLCKSLTIYGDKTMIDKNLLSIPWGPRLGTWFRGEASLCALLPASVMRLERPACLAAWWSLRLRQQQDLSRGATGDARERLRT